VDLEQLKTFVTISQYKNYTKAAEYLNVTQPTVTARIQNLENEFNCKLLHRNGKSVALTEEGEVLLSYAIKMIQDTYSLKERISNIDIPNLNVGFTPAFSYDIIHGAISLFLTHKSSSKPSISITEGNDGDLISKKIKSGELDFGIVRDTISFDEELEQIFITVDKVILIVGKSHPLAEKNEITNDDLVNQTLVTFLRHTSMIQRIEQNVAGIKGLKLLEVGNFGMMKSFVRNGLGVSIVPQLAISNAEGFDKEICVKSFNSIEKEIPLNVVAIFKKYSPNIVYFKLFIEIFKKTLEIKVPKESV
jgi:DNA-binding transcriptional LysR family regulator